MSNQTKKCGRCKGEFELEKFGKDKRTPTGKKCWCRKCINESNSKMSSERRKKHNTILAATRRNKINNGECRDCRNPRLENIQACLNCWFKRMAKEHLNNVKYAKFLQELAEKQNYKCFYTDEILIPGINMSLDHIISIYDRPDLRNDPNNVQWVTFDINTIKNKLSHDSFLSVCKNVAKKYPLNC